jgi:hypothetical protein
MSSARASERPTVDPPPLFMQTPDPDLQSPTSTRERIGNSRRAAHRWRPRASRTNPDLRPRDLNAIYERWIVFPPQLTFSSASLGYGYVDANEHGCSVPDTAGVP